MMDLFKKDDLVSVKQLNELLQKFKKNEIEEKKTNPWLIAGLVGLGLAVAGVVVYKVFFAAKDDDSFDEFDDDFDDLEYDDDYDDFDDFEDDEFDDDLEDDFDDFEEDDFEEDIEDDFDEEVVVDNEDESRI